MKDRNSVLVLDGQYASLDDPIEKILEAFPLSWKGKRVLLKPNILGPYGPEKGITTHPSLIRSLVRSLRKREATCLLGDNPGMEGYAANERCARISGIFDASEGGYVNFALETVQTQVNSRFLEKLAVSKQILDADILINLPKFKTHIQTKITGAVKNMFGILVGAEKARVHVSVPQPKHFSEVLVDIYQVRIPDLTIMDAIVGMEGNGPSGKDLRPVGKIIASPNGVAVDGLMAVMMGLVPPRIDHLAIASQRGLGEIDPAEMEIQGNWAPLSHYRMPLPFVSQGWLGTVLNKLYYRSLLKPQISFRQDLCTRCGVCVRQCPAQALCMEDIPFLDPQKCIACYCCYELCSSQAIELRGKMRRFGKRNGHGSS